MVSMAKRTILAVDPGESSGFIKAVVEDGKWAIVAWGVWHGLAELDEMICSHLFDGLSECVVEDYRVYPNRAVAHIGSQVYTAREIGRIEWICYLRGVPVTFQAASKAKQAWPDSRVRNHIRFRFSGYDAKARHVKDAMRHLLTYLEDHGVRI